MACAINADEVSEKIRISGQAAYDDFSNLDVEVTWGNGEVSSLHGDDCRPVTTFRSSISITLPNVAVSFS